MQEMSLQEIDQVNGGVVWAFLVGYVASKALDWTVEQASKGKIDYSGYVNDNPNYWFGA